ncbi:MAG: helix-turn-helix domain-containing protein [Actinomycetota bacterium]
MSERIPTRGEEYVSVSVAARMLGVSPSSLRAWAAAGLVPHRRTTGGHRRFEPSELEEWLAQRGGAPPAAPAPHAPPELLATRIDALPALAEAIRGTEAEVADSVDAELATAGTRASVRAAAARRRRLAAATSTLADALETGDLAGPFREAEWQGYRGGAGGAAGEGSLMEVLAFRRAVERSASRHLAGRPPAERRVLERALDRMAIRTVIGYAEGLKSRRRQVSR